MAAGKLSTKKFKAVLERMASRLNWIIARIPFDAAKVWGKRGQMRVRGEINGFEFASSIFPDGRGGHFLMVNRKMLKGGHASPGSTAQFVLTPDLNRPEAAEPKELLSVLKESKQLQKFYSSFSNSMKNYIAKWVAEGKQASTRQRRAEQMAVRLMETMEAEHELPPMVRMAIDRTPMARIGWEKMTPRQRRGELLGIFYYRDPTSRARRLAKAIEVMLEHAENARPTL